MVLKIVITGAAGQIAYSLLPLICSGSVFGSDEQIELRLLDIAGTEMALQGISMELEDCGFPLLHNLITTTELEKAFTNIDVAILLGGFPRKEDMQRNQLIAINAKIFKSQGEALEKFSKRNVKVIVVANPANTNCLIAMKHAPSIPRKNFTALTRLDHERMRSFITRKLQNTHPSIQTNHVKNCVIWGNHSSTQVPDATFVRVECDRLNVPLSKLLPDMHFTEEILIKQVQERGVQVIKARKLSSAMSAASAIAAHLRDWLSNTRKEEYISMGICSDDNPYDIASDLIFSFPVKCTGNGDYELINNLEITPKMRMRMKQTEEELQMEKKEAFTFIQS